MTNFPPRQMAGAGLACLEKVLSRLDKVKANSPGKWKACCPAHNDRDSGLSTREVEDGKVLLHCWAGCDAESITATIGLNSRTVMITLTTPEAFACRFFCFCCKATQHAT
ncbi:hypothetical protein ACYCFC_15380 [Stutzerimonas sp. NM35]